jgi:hypothetical protein
MEQDSGESRDGGKMEAQPGIEHASPAGNGGAPAQLGYRPAPAQPKMERAGPAAGEVPAHTEIASRRPKPGFRAMAQAGIDPAAASAGRDWAETAQNLFMPARRGRIRCMPAHEREYRPGKNICRPRELYAGPGSVEVDPRPTYVGRDINMPAGTYICWPEEAECRPGDADVDPGQTYAGPDELMSAREAEEDLKCSETVLMSSPRAHEEDPVRMYSYQRHYLPHGGRQMLSW